MRTVGVRLEAEVKDYTQGVTAAVEVTDDLDDKIRETGIGAGRTGKSVDGLGRDFRDTAGDAKKLRREIKDVEQSLAALAAEYAAASSVIDRSSIAGSISKKKGELRELTSIENLLPKPAEVRRAGRQFGEHLSDAVKAGMDSAIPYLATAAVAVAPFVGATVAGAVVGVAGLGGIAGGLALAARDPRVQASAKSLGKSILADLTVRGQQFVEPAIQSLNKVGDVWKSMSFDLDRIFKESAKNIDPFVDGLLGGLRKFTHGFADAVSKSGPVVKELGRLFDNVLGSVGDLFTDMSEHADEGARAIHDLTDATVELVHVTGDIVGALSTAYGWYTKVNDKFKEWTDGLSLFAALNPTEPLIKLYDGVKALNSVQTVSGKVHEDMAAALQIAAEKQRKLGGAVDGTTGSVRNQIDALTDLSNRLKGETDPVFGFLNAQDDLRDAQKGVNDAMKEHGKKSPEYQAALRKQAEAALGLEAAAGKVATTSSGKLGPALRATLEQAGFTKDEIANLERQFKTAKAAGDAFAGDYRARLLADTSGAISAMKRAKTLYDQFRSKKITVDVYVAQTAANKVDRQLRGGAFGGNAAGGPIVGPGTGTSDSIVRRLSNGEHVWTAREVQAAGGQRAVAGMRAAVLSGGRVMPAQATGAAQKVIVEVRTVADFRGAGDAMGRALNEVLRTQAGIRATMVKTLAGTSA